MPDISSMYFTAKNQGETESGKATSGKKSRGKKKTSDDDYDEVMPTGGSRRRGGVMTQQQEIQKKQSGTYDSDGLYTVPESKDPKIIYPHKKYKVSFITPTSICTFLITVCLDRRENNF